MQINQQTVIDVINPLSNGVIECRKVTTDDEGNAIYFRWSLNPGQDISNQDTKVQTICNDTWTIEVVNAFNASNVKPSLLSTTS